MSLVYLGMDGSGKVQHQKVTCFASLAGFQEAVNPFSNEWTLLLRKVGLPNLSSKDGALDCSRRLSAEIPAQTIRERIESLKPFAGLIRRMLPNATCVVINSDAFRSMPERYKTALGTKADALAFSLVALSNVRLLDPPNQISLICDEDEEIAVPSYKHWLWMRQRNAEARRAMPSLTFADDSSFPQIQAADFFGSLCRLHSQQEATGIPYDYEPLYRFMVEQRDDASIGMSLYSLDRDTLGNLAEACIQRGWMFPRVDWTELHHLVRDVQRH